MSNKTSDLQKLYKNNSEALVKEYFNKYKDYFKSLSMDYNDLKQEVLMMIHFEILKDYVEKDKAEISRIISGATKNRLNTLLRPAIIENFNGNNDVSDFTTDKIDNNTVLDKKEPLNPAKSKKENLTEWQKLEKDINYLINNHRLHKDAFAIINKIVLENKNFAEVAKELNLDYFIVYRAYYYLLRRYSKINNKLKSLLKVERLLLEEDNNDRNDSFEKTRVATEMEEENFREDMTRMNYEDLKKVLQAVLNEEEFAIFHDHVMDKMTFDKIGKILGISRQGVEQKYKDVLKKIKYKLRKDIY